MSNKGWKLDEKGLSAIETLIGVKSEGTFEERRLRCLEKLKENKENGDNKRTTR